MRKIEVRKVVPIVLKYKAIIAVALVVFGLVSAYGLGYANGSQLQKSSGDDMQTIKTNNSESTKPRTVAITGEVIKIEGDNITVRNNKDAEVLVVRNQDTEIDEKRNKLEVGKQVIITAQPEDDVNKANRIRVR